jgi:hypothetical protein
MANCDGKPSLSQPITLSRKLCVCSRVIGVRAGLAVVERRMKSLFAINSAMRSRSQAANGRKIKRGVSSVIELDWRNPKDSEHKITKKTKGLSHLYSLRFLGFLLFITSVPHALSAVRSSVASEPCVRPRRYVLGLTDGEAEAAGEIAAFFSSRFALRASFSVFSASVRGPSFTIFASIEPSGIL